MSAWRTVRRCTWCRSANSRMLSPSSRCWRRILSNSSTLDNSFSLAPTVWQPRSVGAGARGWGHLWPSLRPLLGPDQAVIPTLLAKRGFAVPGMPGVRLRTLADVVAYAQAEGVELRLDGTETQVRRPRANRSGRRAFISGKRKQNTIKVTTVCDRRGRTLWAGAVRPGRMHDQTAIKTEGIEDLLRRHHDVHATVYAGYRGLAKAFGGQVHAPPPKPAKDEPPQELEAWQRARKQQSSQRICVEHANAEHKQWRALQRWIGRREYYAETHLAIAGLVSDRTARR